MSLQSLFASSSTDVVETIPTYFKVVNSEDETLRPLYIKIYDNGLFVYDGPQVKSDGFHSSQPIIHIPWNRIAKLKRKDHVHVSIKYNYYTDDPETPHMQLRFNCTFKRYRMLDEFIKQTTQNGYIKKVVFLTGVYIYNSANDD